MVPAVLRNRSPVLKVGKLEVIASGTVVGYSDYPLTIDLNGTGEIIVEFRFTLNEQEPDAAGTMETSVVNNHHVLIELKNFVNPLGTGLISPIRIGTYQTADLHLGFVHALVGTHKAINLLHYTFYSGAGLE